MNTFNPTSPRDAFYQDVVSGLARDQKSLPPKYFYDSQGSKLFDDICRLDSYYVTRTEVAVLQDCVEELNELLDKNTTLFEYGSGVGVKVRILLDHLTAIKTWVPIEICKEQLVDSAEKLKKLYPNIKIIPVCTDYMRAHEITLPEQPLNGHRVVFFPGSTIGNLSRNDTDQLISNSAKLVGDGGGMILGIDLIKDREVLLKAYDDDQGVTAAFNLNVLRRIKNELDAEIDLSQFSHQVRFNEQEKRIEMHLVSDREQCIKVGDQEFFLAEGETIHTESSHKFCLDEFSSRVDRLGFRVERVWQDARKYFAVLFLRRTS